MKRWLRSVTKSPPAILPNQLSLRFDKPASAPSRKPRLDVSQSSLDLPSQRSKLWTPHAYQRRGVKWLLEHNNAALFLDPGLGKTSIALKALTVIKKACGSKALVVAPLRVAQLVWTREGDGELSKWSDFQGLRVELLHGLDKEAALQRDADLYVINYEGLKWLCSRPPKVLGYQREKAPIDKLFARGVDTLVIDELSKMKHVRPRSRLKRSHLVVPYLPRFRRRWGLTGSPAANGLADLFGEVYVLDLGKRLGQFISRFRNRWFYPTGPGGFTLLPVPTAQREIQSAIRDLALSIRATDHLDLPDLVEQNVWVTLPPAARKAYDEVERDLITELEDGTITAANAAVASAKLRQITSGGCYTARDTILFTNESERQWAKLHDEKTDAVSDLVDELQGQPLLIIYDFKHDLERLQTRLGEFPTLGGGLSTKAAVDIMNRWNNGEIPVLGGHPKSMGHGLNMQGSNCAHVCFHTLTWDFDLYTQTIARVWRQGAKAKRIIVQRVLARDTIDESVAKTIAAKRRGQDALLDALKDRATRILAKKSLVR